MGHGWEPGWDEAGGRRDRLPRIEDLPPAEHGYDREAVERAFDAFYRHAAQLDTSLRALEAVEAFQRQATELRADMRALRAAAWGPTASRPAWTASYSRERRGGVPEAVPRLAVEATFIVLVAVGAALADVRTALVIVLVLGAWLIVGLGELVIATARPAFRRTRAPAAAPAANVVEAAPAPVGEDTEEAAVIAAAGKATPAEAAQEDETDEAPPEEGAVPAVAEEAKRRRRWFRRGREPEAQPEPQEPPRHVRVLPLEPAPVSVDPWEHGPELPAAAAAEVAPIDEAANEPELEEQLFEEEDVAAAEPGPPAEPDPSPVRLVEAEPPAEPEAPEAVDEPAAAPGLLPRDRLRRGRR